MLLFAENECRRRNTDRLVLRTTEIQTAPLALYQSAGYKLVRIETADILNSKTVASGLRRHFLAKTL
jgi:putative acetyltransferase